MSVAARGGLITAVDHVAVGVRDLDAGVWTAAALLGGEPSWRGSHPAKGTTDAIFRLANSDLDLMTPDGESAVRGRVLARSLEQRGEGLFALAFATDDVEAFAARMRAWDVDVERPSEGRDLNADGSSERTWFSLLLPTETSRGIPVLAIEHRSGGLPEMARTAEPASGVTALDHVVILSPELEASRVLYEDVLGLRLALDRTFAERGQRILFFRVGGATVEVVGPADPQATRPGHDRLWGLAWRVADAERGRKRLVDAGFDVSPVRDGAKPGTRVCTVRGEPLGVPTLLVQAGEEPERPADAGSGGGVR